MLRPSEVANWGVSAFLAFSAAFWLAVAEAQTGHDAAYRHLPAPNATIYPGDVINASMLSERAFAASAAKGVFDSTATLAGKVARRTLMPGQPVPLAAVRAPYVVMPGRAVMLLFRQRGLTISAAAMPLQPGGPGDIINVRNTESGVTVKGVVIADGTVSAGAP
ncbi:MAG: flagellar basal body P-ring formation chaperone FlgA [Hyphomicrobiales bacterium]|nr:flagellar basal body P-ring formation chaperone FlgA [Hyphomicrobiales bacterium]